MAEMKTKPTRSSVPAFLNGIADEQRRKDCATVARIMKQVTRTMLIERSVRQTTQLRTGQGLTRSRND